MLKLYLDEEGVKHYLAYSPYHANYGERAIRTVKNKLYRHFTKTESSVWLPVIDAVADSLNSTIDSTINMAPNDISNTNERDVYDKVYLSMELKREKEPVVYKFEKGDKVHISSQRGCLRRVTPHSSARSSL